MINLNEVYSDTYFRLKNLWDKFIYNLSDTSINGLYLILISIIACCILPEHLWFILASSSIIYFMYILHRYIRIKESESNLSFYDENTPNILNNIINDAFDEYIIYNKGFEKEKEYIREKEEREIINEMINLVSSRLSENMIHKLESYYNKDTLSDIISSKIYMAVTAYVAANNTPTNNLPNYNSEKQSSQSFEDITRYL